MATPIGNSNGNSNSNSISVFVSRTLEKFNFLIRVF